MEMPAHAATAVERQIRTLYVVSDYLLGGAESYVVELLRLLDGTISAGVVAVRGDDRSEMGQHMTLLAKKFGATIYMGSSSPWKFGGFIVSALRLRRVIQRFKP